MLIKLVSCNPCSWREATQLRAGGQLSAGCLEIGLGSQGILACKPKLLQTLEKCLPSVLINTDANPLSSEYGRVLGRLKINERIRVARETWFLAESIQRC